MDSMPFQSSDHSRLHYTSFTHCWHGLWEQFGVHYLAQEHFEMQTEGARDHATDLLIGGGPTLPREVTSPEISIAP